MALSLGHRPRGVRPTDPGLHSSPAYIASPADQSGVAINLRPAGARRLFGLPASALAGRTVELADLAGPIGRELWERVQSVDDPAAWFGVCDQVLQRLLGRSGASVTAAEVRRAWQLLDASGGSSHIGAVAREVGWSRRHLNRRFRAEYGVSPKQLARIIRFEWSRDVLRGAPGRSGGPTALGSTGPIGSLAELAAACGYADQAHLTREWAFFHQLLGWDVDGGEQTNTNFLGVISGEHDRALWVHVDDGERTVARVAELGRAPGEVTEARSGANAVCRDDQGNVFHVGTLIPEYQNWDRPPRLPTGELS